MVDTCNIIKIPENWNVKREPTRPLELRRDYFGGMKFNENYDWHNLWYDAVFCNNRILLIGPPLNNLISQFEHDPLVNSADIVLPVTAYNADRMSITVVDCNDNSIQFRSGSEIKINKASDEFVDRICMFTLQKDNPIAWIRSWISYHANLGVDSFLIYDNNSATYTTDYLEKSISMPGLTIKVVEWNVPYGPQGFDCDYYNTWDSDYAQSAMFEHAKHRYLSNSRLAINADIDELLVLPKNLDNIIDDLHNSNVSGYTYKGRWIEPYDIIKKTQAAEVQLDQRRFENYYCTDHTNPYGIGNKWMIIPRLSINSQWSVHSTTAKMLQNDSIYYGHYLAMNTNWSWGRDRYDRNTENLVADMKLMHNLSKIRNLI